MTQIARQVFVSGRVQGVWYRAWTCQEAEALGLTGWVRNLRDGRVEALLVGEEAAVSEMLVCMRSGPPLAQVTGLEVLERESAPHQGFAQRSSA